MIPLVLQVGRQNQKASLAKVIDAKEPIASEIAQEKIDLNAPRGAKSAFPAKRSHQRRAIINANMISALKNALLETQGATRDAS